MTDTLLISSSSLGMETVTTYLESGSINGLNHIAATKKWDRLFWILVVKMGFIISTFLIVQMYIAWGENPIRTDVDTLPMSEISFPKVTVCPPKGTFTDLNYDIKRAEKKNLTLKEREALSDYARDTIENISFMENLNTLQYEDRFYNWYYAISNIEGNDERQRVNFLSAKIEYPELYIIDTMATSGVITSQFFGKKFSKNNIRNISIDINVKPPNSFYGNEQNLTYHLHLEKVSVPGLPQDFQNYHSFRFKGADTLGDDENTAHYTMTTKAYSWESLEFRMDLKLDNKYIRHLEMDQMPGFNLSWWYTGGDIEPGNIYTDTYYAPNNATYLEFVREVVFSFLVS